MICIPDVLLTPFFSADTTRIRARIVGQCDAGAISTATLSEPFALLPICHATYPPKSDRHALPLPCLAIRDRSVGEVESSNKLAIARTSAAKPAADDARPAAVGKLFSETMRRGRVESFGREGLDASRAERSERSSRKHACVRAPETSWGEELRRRVSSGPKVEEQAAVVCVRRSAWERVTEADELVGRFSFGSRLPQYLEV